MLITSRILLIQKLMYHKMEVGKEGTPYTVYVHMCVHLGKLFLCGMSEGYKIILGRLKEGKCIYRIRIIICVPINIICND